MNSVSSPTETTESICAGVGWSSVGSPVIDRPFPGRDPVVGMERACRDSLEKLPQTISADRFP